MQEEDFLRPDISFDGSKQNWKRKMHKLYNSLNYEGIINFLQLDFGITWTRSIDCGVRRCGMINKDKKPAFPRMHNKFILCYNYNETPNHVPGPPQRRVKGSSDDDDDDNDDEDDDVFVDTQVYINYNDCGKPYGEVITGSFNYSENSNNSLENIVCIKDDKIFDAYAKQFSEIALMSVPLNWDGDWSPNNFDLRYGS